MKAFLGASLGALLLSASAIAATVGEPAGQVPGGLELASTVSTPYTYGNGDSQAAPTFNYEDSVPLTASVTSAGHRAPALRDSTLNLVNQTGGER